MEDRALLVEQKHLKKKGLIGLITVLNMTAPLSTDMYLPAVPTMTEVFNTSAGVLNLTLVGFFFFFAVGMLIFGPLSDKYGRKRVLLTGLAIYILSSILCAVSFSISQLVIFRILQALGAGCMVSVSTALVKDSFDGKIRNVVLATIQSMTVIAPMVAPIIGAVIVSYFSWRVTFWVLGGISFVCFIATIMMDEVLPKDARYQGKISGTIGRLFLVGRNKVFTSFLLINSLTSLAFMGYIAVSAYMYIDYFNLTETQYSIFFAINSAALVLGPMLYIKLSEKIASKKILTAGFIIGLISGLAVLFFGKFAPIVLLLSFIPYSAMQSMMKPLVINILLDQQEKDTGSAASLIHFGYNVAGSAGMILATLPWGNFVSGLGLIMVSCSIISLVGWMLFLKSSMVLKGV
ncbi:multidrug effflux MFS transporter [Virgibacillus ainsalahensis]